jgi:hypothetical protein
MVGHKEHLRFAARSHRLNCHPAAGHPFEADPEAGRYAILMDVQGKATAPQSDPVFLAMVMPEIVMPVTLSMMMSVMVSAAAQ